MNKRSAWMTARLRHAARLVSEVAEELNDASHQCRECGLRRAENFMEAQAREQLQGMVGKLRRWATTIDNPAAADIGGGHERDQQRKITSVRRRDAQRRARPWDGDNTPSLSKEGQ